MIAIGYGSNVSMETLKAWLDVDSDCDFETVVELCEQLGAGSETEPRLVFHFNEANDMVFITEEKLFAMRSKIESFMSISPNGSISSKRLESIAKAMNVPIGICLFVTGSEQDSEVPVEGAVDMLDEIEAGLTQIHDEQSHDESHDEESDEEDACDEEEQEDDIEEDESESQTQVPAFTPQKPFFEIAT